MNEMSKSGHEIKFILLQKGSKLLFVVKYLIDFSYLESFKVGHKVKHCSNSCAASIPICNNNNRKSRTCKHEDFRDHNCIVLSKLEI